LTISLYIYTELEPEVSEYFSFKCMMCIHVLARLCSLYKYNTICCIRSTILVYRRDGRDDSSLRPIATLPVTLSL